MKLLLKLLSQPKQIALLNCGLVFFLGIFLLSSAVIGQTTVPTSLANGAQYRLIFATSGTRDATSANIADYNSFVTTQAGELVSGASWYVVGSTQTVAANVNTGTNTSGGVPIFNLNDQKVADDYDDLWDGSLDNAVGYDQNGNAVSGMTVFTGSTLDGEPYTDVARYLGAPSYTLVGNPSLNGSGWLQAASAYVTDSYRFYAMSSVLTKDGSLPVELSSFSARSEAQIIILQWVTESESDNLGFVLERSRDKTIWTTIASYQTNSALEGQGNTSSRTEYSFTDKMVTAEADYTYRLSEVSIEGERNVIASTSVYIDALPTTTQLFAAYPNPFNPSTTLNYQLAKEEHVEISVYNTLGSFIKTLYSSNQPAGSYQVSWDATNENGSKVPSGTYLIRMQTDQQTQTQKVLLVK